MSEPPAKPAPDPAAGGPPRPKLKPAPGELASGLTNLAKPSDSAPKIDESKRARVDDLWKEALAEGARPSSTIGSLGTVSLHPDSPTVDWQRKLPRAAIASLPNAHAPSTAGAPARVIVDDPTGKVQVHHGDAAADPLAGGTLDALDGRTLDAPPGAAHAPSQIGTRAEAPGDLTRGTTIDLSGTVYAPTQPALPSIPAPGTPAASGKTPLSSTAPTLPGRPVDAPPPGTRMVPPQASRIHAPRPEEFRIQAKLASGGMGEVFVATQLGLNREVALKRPKPSRHDTEARLSAFVREGTVTGDLEHPSIVPIYQNGVDADGLPFYAMKLVHGIEWRYLLHPDLAQERQDPDFIKQVAQKGAAMDLHAHLDVLLKVCDAVAFAHSRHILHRDLKPENVIVGEYGEVQVMDWGLAIDYRDQIPDTAKALSRSNIRGPAGTPAYMAPEMALGDVNKIGPATDVYLLGAILYEILTGRPPHGGSKLDRVLYQAAVNEYLPVRHSNLNVAPGLEAIVDKALATIASARYATVQEFQSALREHLTHEQSLKISTRAEADLDKLSAAASAAGSLTTQSAERREAEHSARYVKFAEIVAAFRQSLELWPLNLSARAGLIRSLTAFVSAALDGGDLGLAHAQIEQLRSAVDHADAAQRENVETLARRWSSLDAQRRARQRNFKLALAGVAVLLAVLVIGGAWSYINIRAEKERAEDNFTEAEKQRQTADEQRKIAEKNFAEAETQRARAEKARLEADQQRQAAETNATLAQKNAAAAIAEKQEADRQRAEADKQRHQAELQKAEAEKQRAIADDQRKVAEAKTVEAQEQRELAEGNLEEAERQRQAAVQNLGAVDIQRARTLIAVHRDYPQAAVFLLRAVENTQSVDSTKARRELNTVFLNSPRRVDSVDFNGDARRMLLDGGSIAVLTLNPQVSWLDLSAEYKIATQKRVGNDPRRDDLRDFVRFGDAWLILDAQGALTRWTGFATQANQEVTAQLKSQPLTVPALNGARVTVLTALPDRNRLVLGLNDGRLLLLKADSTTPGGAAQASENRTLTLICALPAHKGAVSGLAILAAGKQLLSVGADGRLCLWDLEMQKLLRERPAHLGFASALAVDHSAALAATAGPDGAIKVWNLGDFSERLTLQGHLREVGSLAFHPTRPLLASQSFDGTVRLWNLAADPADTPCYATLHVDNPHPTLQVAFSSQDDQLLCLNQDGIELWDLRNRTQVTPEVWQDLRRPGARLLQATRDQVLMLHDRHLLTLGNDDMEPQVQTAADFLGAFHPADNPRRTVALTAAGLFGPPDKLEPLPPADAGKIVAWTRQGPWVLINRGGKFFLADTAQAAWQFQPVPGDGESVGLALSNTGRYFSWNAANRMAFSTEPDNEREIELNFHMPPHAQKILQAAWLPDGQSVVLRTGGNELQIVDEARESVGAIVGHLAPVRTMTLDASGRFLASADASGQVRITDLTDLTGSPLGPPLPAPPDELLFNDDGHTLLCLVGGQLIRLQLPVPGSEEIDELRDTVVDRLGIAPDHYIPRGVRNVLTPAPPEEPPPPPPPPDAPDLPAPEAIP